MIYWDYNAGAPMLPQVAQAMAVALSGAAGNPSSVHSVGRAARKKLDFGRETVAGVFGCMPREVVFTGSGSEAAAIALLGVFHARKNLKQNRVVTSAIEHPSVLGAVEQLKKFGADVVLVKPHASGLVSAAELLSHVNDATLLVSLMWANNETGVIQPVDVVSRECRQRKVLFHTDAVQAVGRVSATLRDVPADLLTFSAHKFGGPVGTGVLLNRRGIDIAGLTPGHQENGRRGGTQNFIAAEALALALTAATSQFENENKRLAQLRDLFEREVKARIAGVTVNGGSAARLSNTSNLQFEGIDGEALLIALDLEGICVSSGAACASGSLTPSHVLTAMGLTASRAQASLRFSLGTGSSESEVQQVIAALERHVPRIRAEVSAELAKASAGH